MLMPSSRSVPKVIQELGCWGGARNKQMIPGAGACNVQQVAFGVVNLFQIGVDGNGLNPVPDAG